MRTRRGGGKKSENFVAIIFGWHQPAQFLLSFVTDWECVPWFSYGAFDSFSFSAPNEKVSLSSNPSVRPPDQLVKNCAPSGRRQMRERRDVTSSRLPSPLYAARRLLGPVRYEIIGANWGQGSLGGLILWFIWTNHIRAILYCKIIPHWHLHNS